MLRTDCPKFIISCGLKRLWRTWSVDFDESPAEIWRYAWEKYAFIGPKKTISKGCNARSVLVNVCFNKNIWSFLPDGSFQNIQVFLTCPSILDQKDFGAFKNILIEKLVFNLARFPTFWASDGQIAKVQIIQLFLRFGTLLRFLSK